MRILVDYGKSMYGGWYANYFITKWEGISANTKTELAQKLDRILGKNCWTFAERIDN